MYHICIGKKENVRTYIHTRMIMTLGEAQGDRKEKKRTEKKRKKKRKDDQGDEEDEEKEEKEAWTKSFFLVHFFITRLNAARRWASTPRISLLVYYACGGFEWWQARTRTQRTRK